MSVVGTTYAWQVTLSDGGDRVIIGESAWSENGGVLTISSRIEDEECFRASVIFAPGQWLGCTRLEEVPE